MSHGCVGLSSGEVARPAAARLAALRQAVRAIERGGRAEARVRLGPGLDRVLAAGGLALGALHAVQAQAYLDQPAAFGFALRLAQRALNQRPGVLVLLRQRGADDVGAPYGPGLAGLGIDAARLIVVAPPDRASALWALEEALRCPGAAVTLAQLSAPPAPALARRLQLAAEAGGGLGLIAPPVGAGAPATVRSRWRIAAAPSVPPDWAQAAGLTGLSAPPGAPRWAVAVERGARGADGWRGVVEWTDATDGFHCLAPVADGAAAPAPRRLSA